MELYIQDYLGDHCVANKENLSPDKARQYSEGNHVKLKKDKRRVFDFIKNVIEQGGTNETLLFLDAPG